MQDLRDGIISRPIWAVGKLKRVQSSRNGEANVVLYKSLKNPHDCWCEGNWTIVIQARGFTVLRHRDYNRFLKGVGTTEVARDSLKMEVNKPASWSAQDLRTRPVIPSGPAAFLTFTLLSSLQTSSSDRVKTWSLLCLLLPDALLGRVTQPPLHSKQP